jgi:hypothetical protein
VRQSGPIKITLVVDENLRFINEASKGVGVHDAIAVALKLAPHFRRRLGIDTTSRVRIMGGPRRESAAARLR